MQFFKSNGDRVPAAIEKMGEEVRAGRMDRREFLAMASALGASTALAYGMAGLAAPTPALAQEGTERRHASCRDGREGSEGPTHLRLGRAGKHRAHMARTAGQLYA